MTEPNPIPPPSWKDRLEMPTLSNTIWVIVGILAAAAIIVWLVLHLSVN